jgi:hypothetical protein
VVWSHSTYIPRLLSFFSSRPNWDFPTPSPASECASPRTKGGGGVYVHTRLLVSGWGSHNSDDWREESLVLYIFVFKSIYQKSESIGELVEGISNTLLPEMY